MKGNFRFYTYRMNKNNWRPASSKGRQVNGRRPTLKRRPYVFPIDLWTHVLGAYTEALSVLPGASSNGKR